MVRFFFILIIFGKLFSVDISHSHVCQNCHFDDFRVVKRVCEGISLWGEWFNYHFYQVCDGRLSCDHQIMTTFNGTVGHKEELCSNISRTTASPSQSSHTSPQSSSTTIFTEQSTSAPTLNSTSNITSNITSFLKRSAGIDTAALSTGAKVGIGAVGLAGLAGTTFLIYKGVKYLKATNDNKSDENGVGFENDVPSPIYTGDDEAVLLGSQYH